jgi:hypothetical protein
LSRPARYARRVLPHHRLPTLLLLAALTPAPPAACLVVDGPDSDASERAPERDPGWTHVGRLGMVSAIYLGDGWVLTASHAAVGEVEIDGVGYPAVPDSRIWLDLPGRPGTKSDLALFRLDPAPDLPRLELQREPPASGSFVVMVGMGDGRGKSVGTPPNGYAWKPGRVRRWGTNRILATGAELRGPGRLVTRCFRMEFSRSGTSHEAQAAVGDSGGAVFVRDHGAARLAGVMLSINTHPGQPRRVSLYGNLTNAADLSAYYLQIRRAMRRAGAAP